MHSDPLVGYERVNRVAFISLNRPDKLNAITDDMVLQLAQAFEKFDVDDDAWVAVLHGTGRAFSSGADVRQRQLRSEEELRRLGGLHAKGANASRLLTECKNWKPVVVAVHGYVMGMALGLMLQCEVVIAAEGTRFQVTEVGRGLSGAKYHALMRYRGAGTFADDVVTTGRFFSASEAREQRLVNSIVPEGVHLEAAEKMANTIARNPPLGIRATVRLRRWELGELQRECEFQSAALRLHLTEDFRESAKAFTEKREPRAYKAR